jgi:hypothetical protein
MIYLAAPYNDVDPEVVEGRMKIVNKQLASLNMAGKMAFSPLMLHYCLKENELPSSYLFWRNYCRAFIEMCKEVHVLTLPGWNLSEGVRDEIEFATELGIPVIYIKP